MSKYNRRAWLAGRWYPGTQQGIIKNLEESFKSKEGPGNLPPHEFSADKTGDVIGIVSPHAGYQFSWGVAANGFYEIANDGLPNTIILLGSHSSPISSQNEILIQTEGTWESPLGVTAIDEELAQEINGNSKEIEENNQEMISPYRTDNTFGLQLPFIQYLSTNIKLIPMSVATVDMKKLKTAANELASTIQKYFNNSSTKEKKVVFVASTDLTHYGPRFQLMPARGKPPEIQNEWIKANDKKGIDQILSFEKIDTADIMAHFIKNSNICCPGAIILLLETIKQLKDKSRLTRIEAKLLQQTTSYEISQEELTDTNSGTNFSAVGYGSIVIIKQ